jgi:hypothetical protein
VVALVVHTTPQVALVVQAVVVETLLRLVVQQLP